MCGVAIDKERASSWQTNAKYTAARRVRKGLFPGWAGPAAGWGRCAAPYTQTAAQKNQQKNAAAGLFWASAPPVWCWSLCWLWYLPAARLISTGPAKADFGTPAAAWQKNELGYYFNESGEAMPAAVLKGIDVSKYQGAVDWEKAKSNGVDFAIIRCGFGGEWDGQEQGWNQDDPQWRRNADECTRLGIPFGAYIYSYATTEDEARSEADHVARLLGLVAPPQEGLEDYTAAPYRLSYPVYYDLEDKSISGIFPDEMAAITKAFF